jgi:hypothetical protein
MKSDTLRGGIGFDKEPADVRIGQADTVTTRLGAGRSLPQRFWPRPDELNSLRPGTGGLPFGSSHLIEDSTRFLHAVRRSNEHDRATLIDRTSIVVRVVFGHLQGQERSGGFVIRGLRAKLLR